MGISLNGISLGGGGGRAVGDSVTIDSPNKLFLPQDNDPASPTVQFGDGDTGFYEESDDTLTLSIGGTAHWDWNFATFRGNLGFSVVDAAPTETAPNIRPSNIDNNTGIGSAGADQMNLIAGGVNCIGIAENGAAPECGFYATTPIPRQTGVAVTDVAIHASLVALGLITA